MKYLTNIFLLTLITLLFVSCQSNNTRDAGESTTTKDEALNVSLEKVWETDTLLNTAESVLLDSTNNVLYVSCIGGVPPMAKDGDGFIAKVSPKDGSIIDRNWVTQLDAPKGMGLYEGILYVTNIDELVTIDAATGEITNRYPVEGAQFLNDITVDPNGDVYFSDSNTNKVHRFSNGEISVWANVDGGPNGLFYDGEKMMMATFGIGNFNEIGVDSRTVTPVVDSIPGGDGIVKVGLDFLVSNWNGEVYYVTADYNKTKILDTKEIGDNAADIEFNRAKNQLLVPTFFGNKVVAYQLKK